MKKLIKTTLASSILLMSFNAPLTSAQANSPEIETSHFSVAEQIEMERLEDNVAQINSNYKKTADSMRVRRDPKVFTDAVTGTWSWRDGVICVTTQGFGNELINSWHAGIVAPQKNYVVAEAPGLKEAVRLRQNKWVPSKGYTVYQVGVTSTTIQQDYNAGKWAGQQVGKPYNINFWDAKRTDKFYCSQLVWAAYYYTAGVDLNKSDNDIAGKMAIHPGELVNNSKVTLIYKDAR